MDELRELLSGYYLHMVVGFACFVTGIFFGEFSANLNWVDACRTGNWAKFGSKKYYVVPDAIDGNHYMILRRYRNKFYEKSEDDTLKKEGH